MPGLAETSFDEFHRFQDGILIESLRKIVANYGIPNKLINIIKSFYQGSCCAVRTEGVLGELFETHSGVTSLCLVTTFLQHHHGLDFKEVNGKTGRWILTQVG